MPKHLMTEPQVEEIKGEFSRLGNGNDPSRD